MGVIDINALASDGHILKTMKDCVHASVIVSDERVKLGKADANVWGFMHERARIILGNMLETQATAGPGQNEPIVSAHELAASLFKAECDEGLLLATRESRYTDKQLANYKRYSQQLTSGLMDGAPLLAKDDNGNFVLSGKSKFEKWHKDHKEEIEQAKLKEIAAARKHLKVVGAGEGESEAKPTTQAETGSDILDQIKTEEVRDMVLALIGGVIRIEEKSPARAVKLLADWLPKFDRILRSEFNEIANAAGDPAKKGNVA